MDSRMDKYSSSGASSRSSRNKKLYEDLYSDTSYNNSVVLDDSKEIDINKIKEIIDKQNNPEKKKIARPTKDIYDDLDIIKEEVNEKVYDINEVLKEAKSKRDILEEANEKRKTNYKYQSHLEIEKELEKTRKVYDKLLQEETELLDIMNTLTNIPTNNGTNNYKDLTSEANKFKTGTVEVKELTKEIEKTSANNIKDDQDEEDTTTEYSTNTFMFDKRDFVSEDSIKEQMDGTNKFIKVIIFLLTVAIILGAYYVIRTYILK